MRVRSWNEPPASRDDAAQDKAGAGRVQIFSGTIPRRVRLHAEAQRRRGKRSEEKVDEWKSTLTVNLSLPSAFLCVSAPLREGFLFPGSPMPLHQRTLPAARAMPMIRVRGMTFEDLTLG